MFVLLIWTYQHIIVLVNTFKDVNKNMLFVKGGNEDAKTRSIDIIVVSLLLTLNIFYTFF